jgi:hypothetical protein
MLYIPSFIKTGLGIQNLKGGRQIQKYNDLKNLLLVPNMESMLICEQKINNNNKKNKSKQENGSPLLEIDALCCDRSYCLHF